MLITPTQAHNTRSIRYSQIKCYYGYLFSCRILEITAELRLNNLLSSGEIIIFNFFTRHKLDLWNNYANKRFFFLFFFTNFHFTSRIHPHVYVYSHISSVVHFIWSKNIFFQSSSVVPVYTRSGLTSVFIVVWYSTFCIKHSHSKGYCSLQN